METGSRDKGEPSIITKVWQGSRHIDISNKPVYQSAREAEEAHKNGTFDPNKTQWLDPVSGRLFFLCYK